MRAASVGVDRVPEREPAPVGQGVDHLAGPHVQEGHPPELAAADVAFDLVEERELPVVAFGPPTHPPERSRTYVRLARDGWAGMAQTSHVRVMSSGDVCTVTPGGVLVVGRAVAEAAVEDADEAVGDGAEGGVVGVAGGSAGVVEGSGSG